MTERSATPPAPPINRHARARLTWLRLHRWAGLLLLAAFLAMSLSGMTLVLRDTAERLFHPDRFAAAAPTAKPVPPSTLFAAAQAALPADIRATTMQLATASGAVIVTGEPHGPPILGIGPPRSTRVWLDPADARILTSSSGGPDAIFVAKAVHGHLMIAGGGRWAVATAGLLLVFSAASGLWLWWPGMRKIGAALKARKGFSRSKNLHRQLGPLVGLGLIGQGATGVFMALPWLLSPFAAPAALSPEAPVPPSRPMAQTRLSIDAAIAAGQTAARGQPVIELEIPTENAGRWTLYIDDGSVVTVDDRDGFATVAPAAVPSASERAEDTVAQLHGGGYGPVHRIFLFLTGLALSVLSVTGLLLWTQGQRKKSR